MRMYSQTSSQAGLHGDAAEHARGEDQERLEAVLVRGRGARGDLQYGIWRIGFLSSV